MKVFKLILFFLVASFSFAQTKSSLIIVEYSHSLKLEGALATTVNSTLVSNNEHSVYEMDFVGDSNFINEANSEDGAVLYVKATKNPKIYKNLKDRTILSTERIGFKPNLVMDNIDIFQWVLNDNYKTILGYNCQEAKLNYRGRDYIAYFTLDIPFAVGPWKFDGLPGLILEIESVDGAFKINANKLEIKNTKTDIPNPFENEKSIGWNEFITLYKEKYEQLLHYRDPDGGGMSLPKRKIEVLIED